MSLRIGRVVSTLLVFASVTIVVTVANAPVVSAATSFQVAVATGGSIGNMGVDAITNGVKGGGGYYASGVTLITQTTFATNTAAS